MLKQVLVPSKENSTVSIPAEFYGIEVEVVVYPVRSAPADDTLENKPKYKETLKRDKVAALNRLVGVASANPVSLEEAKAERLARQ